MLIHPEVLVIIICLIQVPAVDAGSNVNAPNIDKDGISRPQGSGFDIGCYEYSSASSVEEIISPYDFILYQNYPNPFNPTTKISWQSTVGSHQTLKVYDVLGNLVAILVDEYKPDGEHSEIFDASSLSSGIYFFQLKSGSFIKTKSMILLK